MMINGVGWAAYGLFIILGRFFFFFYSLEFCFIYVPRLRRDVENTQHLSGYKFVLHAWIIRD